MKKKQKPTSSDEVVSPTVTDPKVEINGVAYHLRYDYYALARAEAAMNAEGRNLILLIMMPSPFLLQNTKPLFAAAVAFNHPELTFAQAEDLVTVGNALRVGLALSAAYEQHVRPKPTDEPEVEGPPDPNR